MRGDRSTSRTTGPGPSRPPSAQAYEPTKTVFFSQATDTGCGQATSQVGPFYCPLDRLVYFDLDFLVQLQEQFGATGDLAAQYIVAHEFGHHVQNLLGTNDAVNQAQQQGRRERQRAVGRPRAAGRLLRRRVGLRRVPSVA